MTNGQKLNIDQLREHVEEMEKRVKDHNVTVESML
jgi:archaellum component FlaC